MAHVEEGTGLLVLVFSDRPALIVEATAANIKAIHVDLYDEGYAIHKANDRGLDYIYSPTENGAPGTYWAAEYFPQQTALEREKTRNITVVYYDPKTLAHAVLRAEQGVTELDGTPIQENKNA